MGGPPRSSFLDDPVLKAVFALRTLFAEPLSAGGLEEETSSSSPLPRELTERPAYSLTHLLQQLQAAASLYVDESSPSSASSPDSPADCAPSHLSQAATSTTDALRSDTQSARSARSARSTRSSSSLLPQECRSQDSAAGSSASSAFSSAASLASASSSAPSLRELLLFDQAPPSYTSDRSPPLCASGSNPASVPFAAASSSSSPSSGLLRVDSIGPPSHHVTFHTPPPPPAATASTSASTTKSTSTFTAKATTAAQQERENHARLRFLYTRCLYLVQMICQCLLRRELALQAGVRHWRARAATVSETHSRPDSEIEEALEEMALCGSRLGVRQHVPPHWYLLEKTPLFWCRRLLLSGERRPVHPLTEAARNLAYLRMLSPQLLRPAGRCRLFLHHAGISLHRAAETVQHHKRATHIATSLHLAQGCLRNLHSSLSQLLRRLRAGRDASVRARSARRRARASSASSTASTSTSTTTSTASASASCASFAGSVSSASSSFSGGVLPTSSANGATSAGVNSGGDFAHRHRQQAGIDTDPLRQQDPNRVHHSRTLAAGREHYDALGEDDNEEEDDDDDALGRASLRASAASLGSDHLAAHSQVDEHEHDDSAWSLLASTGSSSHHDLDTGENAYELLLSVTRLAVEVDAALESTLRQVGMPSLLERALVPTLCAVGSTVALGAMLWSRRLALVRLFEDAREAVLNLSTHMYERAMDVWDGVRYGDEEARVLGSRSVDAEEQSLRRMLSEFAQQINRPITDVELDQAVLDGDLNAVGVMQEYEREMRHPLLGFLFGRFTLLLLIQVQKQKVDIEHALEALDRLMRANNLLFRLLAAIPSLVLAQVLFSLVKRLVLPGPAPAPVVHKRLRAGLLAVEHCLVRCAPHHMDPLSTGRLLCVLFHLHQLAETLPVQEQVLFRRHISDLSSPAFNVSHRLAAIQRMHNAHYFLAPQPSQLWQY